MDIETRFRGYLRENGLPLTSAREAILGGILATEGHFDADELHDILKRSGRALSPATIYRALPLFVRSGILKETLPARGRARYEHAWGHEHHDHLECVSCGRVIEFKDDALEQLQTKVCRTHGFTPMEHRLSITGHCAQCRSRGKR